MGLEKSVVNGTEEAVLVEGLVWWESVCPHPRIPIRYDVLLQSHCSGGPRFKGRFPLFALFARGRLKPRSRSNRGEAWEIRCAASIEHLFLT